MTRRIVVKKGRVPPTPPPSVAETPKVVDVSFSLAEATTARTGVETAYPPFDALASSITRTYTQDRAPVMAFAIHRIGIEWDYLRSVYRVSCRISINGAFDVRNFELSETQVDRHNSVALSLSVRANVADMLVSTIAPTIVDAVMQQIPRG